MNTSQKQLAVINSPSHWRLSNAVVAGLAFLLCAGCATTAPRSLTYPGPARSDEQVALVEVPSIVYSVDGSTRNPTGESYYGKWACLSLIPGEHEFTVVVPPGYQVGSTSWNYNGKEKLWYRVKVTLVTGNKYKAVWRFVKLPSLGEYLGGAFGEELANRTELVVVNLGTGGRVGTGIRVKGASD